MPPEAQKTQKINPPVFITIILVLAAIMGSFQIYAGYLSQSIYHNQPENLAVSDPTENWQTYRNEEYGFEFKYPLEFNFCTDKSGIQGCNEGQHDSNEGRRGDDIVIWDIYDKAGDPIKNSLQIRPLTNRLGESAIEFGKKIQEVNFEEGDYVEGTGTTTVFSGAVAYSFDVVDGFTQRFLVARDDSAYPDKKTERCYSEGYMYKGECWETGGSGWVMDGRQRIIYVDYSGIIYRITYPTYNPVFEKILSTFKFISTSTEAASSQSGIVGKVTIGPTCPVESYPPDPNCADKPYQTKLRIVKYNTDYVVFTESDSKGRFSIPLDLGNYIITIPDLSNQMPTLLNTYVKVEKNKFTEIQLKFDSGIR